MGRGPGGLLVCVCHVVASPEVCVSTWEFVRCEGLRWLVEMYRKQGISAPIEQVTSTRGWCDDRIGGPEEYLARSSTSCERPGWLELLLLNSMLGIVFSL